MTGKLCLNLSAISTAITNQISTQSGWTRTNSVWVSLSTAKPAINDDAERTVRLMEQRPVTCGYNFVYFWCCMHFTHIHHCVLCHLIWLFLLIFIYLVKIRDINSYVYCIGEAFDPQSPHKAHISSNKQEKQSSAVCGVVLFLRKEKVTDHVVRRSRSFSTPRI